MLAALQKRVPENVPTWELEFHHWDQASGRHLVLGREFAALSAAEQRSALALNADIIVSVAGQLHFAAINVPGSYWEIAPGVPAYFWLPDEARLKQVELLARAHRGLRPGGQQRRRGLGPPRALPGGRPRLGGLG